MVKEKEKAAHTADQWYRSYVPPTEAVAKYASSPPQGMTNPPQSEKVRRMLAEELNEYQVQFQGPVWPLKLPPKEGPPVSLLTSKTPKRPSPRRPNHSILSLQEQRSGQHLTVERKPELIAAKWQKVASAEFGNTLTKMQRAESAPVLGSKSKAKSKSKKKQAKSGGHQSSTLPAASDVRRPNVIVTQGKVVPARAPDDYQIRNACDALRSQAALHQASVMDRYRFGADLQDPSGMVLFGPGATPAAPGMWASDMSSITSFHNKAIRLVNPSKLKELPKPERRRKKKQNEEEESSVFVARYAADTAPKALRTLRLKAFPEKEDEGPVSEDLKQTISAALKSFSM